MNVTGTSEAFWLFQGTTICEPIINDNHNQTTIKMYVSPSPTTIYPSYVYSRARLRS
jgi:hypothetical protein